MTEQETSLRSPAQYGRRRRAEQGRRRRVGRIALVAGLLALALALAIPAVGYYTVFVRPLRQTALVVGDVSFSWADYLMRTRMLIAQAQASGTWQPDTLNDLVFDMLDEIEREEIVRQAAALEGLTIAPEELQREVRVRILGQAQADDPNVPESEFRERYRRRLSLLKVSQAEFEAVAETAVRRRRYEEVLKERVPAQAMQRHVFAIRVSELEDARSALSRIAAGEEFSRVAEEVSRDPKGKESGGDWGWVPLGVKEELDSILFELGDGEVRGPIFGQAGVFIVKAVGMPELRDLSVDDRSTLRNLALNRWLLERRMELAGRAALQRPAGGINTARYNWILNQLSQDRDLFPRRGTSG